MDLPGAIQQAARIWIPVGHPVTPVHHPALSSWVWRLSRLSRREVIGLQEQTLYQSGWKVWRCNLATYSILQMRRHTACQGVTARGQPGWLRGLAPPSAQVVILETWDQVPYLAPCMEPASPSACVSASLSLSHALCLS